MSRSSSFFKSISSDSLHVLPGFTSDLVHLAQAAKSVITSSSPGLLEVMLSNEIFRTKSASFPIFKCWPQSVIYCTLEYMRLSWGWFLTLFIFYFTQLVWPHIMRGPHIIHMRYEPFSSSAFCESSSGGCSDRCLTSWIVQFTGLTKI